MTTQTASTLEENHLFTNQDTPMHFRSLLPNPKKRVCLSEKLFEYTAKLNKLFSQKEKSETETLDNSMLKDNSILVSANEIKIVLSKFYYSQHEAAHPQAGENYQEFCDKFFTKENFPFELLDSTTQSGGQNSPKQNPLLSTPFSDKNDDFNLISSQEKETLYQNMKNFNAKERLNFQSKDRQVSIAEKEMKKLGIPVYLDRKNIVIYDQNENEQNQFPSTSFEEESEHRLNKKTKRGSFKCDFCNAVFPSHQGLGGHMSRTHKDQSLKFKKKKEIRENRTLERDMLGEAKKIFCERRSLNFIELMKTKMGKNKLKKLIDQNQKEFRNIRKEVNENTLM